MVRRYIKFLKNPVVYYWFGIPFVGIFGVFKREELKNSVDDINIHDTYFVATQDHLTLIYSFFLAILGLIYFLCQRAKLPLHQMLSLLHSFISILGVVYLLFPFTIFSRNESARFSSVITDLNTNITMVLSLVVLCQVLLPINIIYAVLKKRAK
jgi:heme/copper-type cytochrome/quinol oxidase subunit 1